MAQSKTDTSEWRVVTETRQYQDIKRPDGSPETFETSFLKRDDGATFERTGLGRPEEMTEFFTCKGAFGEFTFSAERWDLLKGKPLDTYTVKLYSHMDKSHLRLALSHAKDIESALLRYPVMKPFFNGMPVKKVLFRVGDVRNFRTLLAQEL